MNIIQHIKSGMNNFYGWNTNRKIIVIESDDWGSIRMPSKEVFNLCKKKGYGVDTNPYESFDSLASQSDLELLFDVLFSVKDAHNNPAVLTANCVVANPDFDKIKESNFENYYYETIDKTFMRYPNHFNNLSLWKIANSEGIFHPQFHAREHLNVSKFMLSLQNFDSDVHFGFTYKMPGCVTKNQYEAKNLYVEATMYNSLEDKKQKLLAYLDGLSLFEKTFGYKSLSVIPPNYTWSNDFNTSISENGVRFLQGIRKYREPVVDSKMNYISRYTGKENADGLIDIVRNVFFEPTLQRENNTEKRVISEIKNAFFMKKPAVICSHRINYVGFIDEKNRDNNLVLLKNILRKIVQLWPDVEFMTSDKLGQIIKYETL